MASRELRGWARARRAGRRSAMMLGLGLGLLHCGSDEPNEAARRSAAAATATECAAPLVHYRLRVVAKSYIASLPLDHGAPPLPYNETLFGLLGDATAIAYHEDPTARPGCDPTGIPLFDTDSCRLRMQADFTVGCQGSKLVQFDKTAVSEVAGHEGPLQGSIAKAFAKAEITRTATGGTVGAFRVLVFGHPADGAEPAFQLVRERENADIWNHSSGTVQCTPSGLRASIGAQGSKFPSHRAWIFTLKNEQPNKLIAFSQRDQGLFGDLWTLEPVPNL